MAVALVAYRQLTPQEKARVNAVLRRHPDFALLRRHADQLGGDFDQAIFITASRWPDLIRGDRRFFEETKGEAPTRRQRGFPDMKKHEPWHFKDLGFSPDGTRVQPPPADNNAEVAMRDARRLIRAARTSQAHKAYYLAWLEHLVGDVHQPLHATARFTRQHRNGDAGGNLFKIAPFRIPELSFDVDNLHSFWDGSLGDDMTLADIEALADAAEASGPAAGADDLDEATWLNESFELAKSEVYADLVEGAPASGRRRRRVPARPRPTLSNAYLENARAHSLRRVKLAGHRLAAVIQQDLR